MCCLDINIFALPIDSEYLKVIVNKTERPHVFSLSLMLITHDVTQLLFAMRLLESQLSPAVWSQRSEQRKPIESL